MSVIAYSSDVEQHKDEIVSDLRNYNYDYNLDVLDSIKLDRDLKISSIFDDERKNVIIDISNLPYVSDTSALSRAKKTSNIIRKLRIICHVNNIKCLLLTTTYRSLNNEQVTLNGGSSILYASDFIVLISSENGEAKYKYVKNRHN
jgi:hypothetical protein